MNADILKGKWNQIKGDAKKAFGKLTDDDMLVIEGDMTKAAGLLQERYGYTREEAETRWNTFADRFSETTEAVKRKAGDALNTMSDKHTDSDVRKHAVTRFFADWASASRAVDALHAAGFQDGHIGILARDSKGSDTSATTHGDKTVADDEVASSAVAGAAVGGVTGLLAALVALAIPGAGPFIAGGVLASTLGAAAAGSGIGAVAGGLIGALTNMGVTEEDARYYDEGVRNGGTLVVVNDAARADEAGRILDQHGGRQRI